MMKRRSFCLLLIVFGLFSFIHSPRTASAQAGNESDMAAAMKTALANSEFDVQFDRGALTRLRRVKDRHETEYIASEKRIGDIALQYRIGNGEWEKFLTYSERNSGKSSWKALKDGFSYTTRYDVQNDDEKSLMNVDISYLIQDKSVQWTIALENTTDKPIEIGDLALPLPMNTNFRPDRATFNVFKHSLIAGDGSFLFWMRTNSVGPYLTMVPTPGTSFEYWSRGRQMAYQVYIHSKAAAETIKGKNGTWRQENTSLILAPRGQKGSTKSYSVKFRWADDYDGVRQVLVEEKLIDVQVVPGMTVPSDLTAKFALRTTEKIEGIDPEFPKATAIQSLGESAKDTHIYSVKFDKLGENKLTVRFGGGRKMILEFFSTEPLETLIKKRAAFIAKSQHVDSKKWYYGLLSDWNMETKVLLGPDNYDKIKGWRIYEVSCDDPGLAKPAYLAAKNAEYPNQKEIDALDLYIKHFVWGGLQQTTEEAYPYSIYGIPDWKVNRDSKSIGRDGQTHLWRIYDYPHVVQVYFGMFRVAKNYPEIKTAMSAKDYLRRAYGTAVAMFTIPNEIEGWQAYSTGLYNELTYVDLMDALEENGMSVEAARLRKHWEKKVREFVLNKPDLFQSEYAFDSTGFESTHALAKYALKMAETPVVRPRRQNANQTEENQPEAPKMQLPPDKAKTFMDVQLAANIFCRGWIETAYYYLGSDYRGGAGEGYTLSYMAPMGGWGVLDYSLYYAKNAMPYVRLGYASYLSSWALMNTGTPESNYGYWFPGKENDGGCGGGFEPAAFGQTWLEQPHHRGSWYYSCETDLGYCGSLRTSATILADDPIFGRFCYGGDFTQTGDRCDVLLKDGLRKRFHALLGDAKLHFIIDRDHLSASKPLSVKQDLSEMRFVLQSDNPADHVVKANVTGLQIGSYLLLRDDKKIGNFEVKDGKEVVVELPLNAQGKDQTFTFVRNKD